LTGGRFAAVREILARAVADRAFPSAVVEVGDTTSVLWREAFGRFTFDAETPAAAHDTVFDLASLTKVLATSLFVMRDVEHGRLALDEEVGLHLPRWKTAARERVTIRDLLSHSSGLPAHRPFFREYVGREAFERAICMTPLEYVPRMRSIYSDLGFMLLGFILEDGGGLPQRLDALKRHIGTPEDLQFNPPESWRRRTAPAHHDPWRGRLLVGEVDDENAYALGGAAGHAGLFGTAAAVGDVARHLLQVIDGRKGAFGRESVMTLANRREDVPGSSRALGWDTMLPTSSCGTRMSARAFGHTGFTGTSLWIDPERGVYVVLLTNRVYPDRKNDAIARVRPAVHDAVMEALDRR
jgi:CubicO group peptidase (beta-lactamase class C family)